MSERREELIPALGVVTEIRKDTPDVKTFRVVTPDGKKAFEHKQTKKSINLQTLTL